MNWTKYGGLTVGLWLTVGNVIGQGLLVDEASGTPEEIINVATKIPQNDLAQSFTPALNAVGFVQLRSLLTGPSGSSVTVVVNLRQGTYNGPIVSGTDPLVIVNFADVGTFYFPDNIPVTPGQLYFFQPVLQSGGSLDIGYKSPSSYSGGEAWNNGLPSVNGADYWFREGMVVPEPSIVALFVLGSSLFILRRHVGKRS